jgi:hypothetical protein
MSAPTSEIPHTTVKIGRGQKEQMPLITGISHSKVTCQLPECTMEVARQQCLLWVFFLWTRNDMKGLDIHVSGRHMEMWSSTQAGTFAVLEYYWDFPIWCHEHCQMILPCHSTGILLRYPPAIKLSCHESALSFHSLLLFYILSYPRWIQSKSFGQQICFHYIHRGNCL